MRTESRRCSRQQAEFAKHCLAFLSGLNERTNERWGYQVAVGGYNLSSRFSFPTAGTGDILPELQVFLPTCESIRSLIPLAHAYVKGGDSVSTWGASSGRYLRVGRFSGSSRGVFSRYLSRQSRIPFYSWHVSAYTAGATLVHVIQVSTRRLPLHLAGILPIPESAYPRASAVR